MEPPPKKQRMTTEAAFLTHHLWRGTHAENLMKKLLAALLFCFCLVPMSHTQAAEKPKIVIYTSMYEDIIEAMTDVMREKFPNYDVQFFYGGTGTLQAKIAAERDTKKLGCDMLMLADPSYALELKADGLCIPIFPKKPKTLPWNTTLKATGIRCGC